jgi:GntR family transcriptional repressor for pyruvate dehydrogenase complex
VVFLGLAGLTKQVRQVHTIESMAAAGRRAIPGSSNGEPAEAPGHALKQLQQYIRKHRLEPGSKLPAERKLADQLHVSRPALREAIQAMAVLEVLVSRRRDGTYIRSLANLEGNWPSDPRLDDSDFDTIQLLEVRKMIEPQAAALAAGRASEQQLREIKAHLLRMNEYREDIAIREEADFLFHDAIIRAAGNRVLLQLANSLKPLMIKSREITGQTHHDMNRLIRQHTAIYEAIRLGNASLAEEAMRQHLLGVGVDLIGERPL